MFIPLQKAHFANRPFSLFQKQFLICQLLVVCIYYSEMRCNIIYFFI
jgi:hypothetical protein